MSRCLFPARPHDFVDDVFDGGAEVERLVLVRLLNHPSHVALHRQAATLDSLLEARQPILINRLRLGRVLDQPDKQTRRHVRLLPPLHVVVVNRTLNGRQVTPGVYQFVR